MREVVLFVEDEAHKAVVGRVVMRLAEKYQIEVQLDWRSAVHGHGRVVQELTGYLRDLRRQSEHLPDLIVVATDANCKGLNERLREIQPPEAPAIDMAYAVPEPHVERWLLLDGAAFRAVFGRGCQAPDQKCDRDRYKELLIHAVMGAGVRPNLGGIEFADDIMRAMDLSRAARLDASFGRFVGDLSRIFRSWKT